MILNNVFVQQFQIQGNSYTASKGIKDASQPFMRLSLRAISAARTLGRLDPGTRACANSLTSSAPKKGSSLAMANFIRCLLILGFFFEGTSCWSGLVWLVIRATIIAWICKKKVMFKIKSYKYSSHSGDESYLDLFYSVNHGNNY